MKNYFLFYALAILIFSTSGCDKSKATANTDKNLKGCGDFIVNKIIDDDMMMSVWIDQRKIPFKTFFQNFENIANHEFARVEIEQNCDIDNLWANTCNDVIMLLGCQTSHWTLQSGKLSFKVNKVLPVYHCAESYLATVILQNATFKNDDTGETMTFTEVDFTNVQVGWCAG